MNDLLFFLIAYVIPLTFCIIRGKQKKDSFIAKIGLIPFLNVIVAACILEGLFTEWIEK